MAAPLEDHERRIAALERTTERDRSVERAAAEIVADSERRLTARIDAAERRMVDILNERFDKVMDALDRPKPRKTAPKKKGGRK